MASYEPYYELMGEGVIENGLNPYREMIGSAVKNYSFFDHVTFSLRDIVEMTTENKAVFINALGKYKSDDTEVHIERSECANTECDCIVIKCGMSGVIRIYLFTIAIDKRKKKYRYCALFDFHEIEFISNMANMHSHTIAYYESAQMNIASNVLSMIVLCMNFDEFYKDYKISSLKVSSITALVHKYVKPMIDDTVVDFWHDSFIIISTADKHTIYRRRCGYDEYVKSIKDFAEKLKEKLYNNELGDKCE